MHEIQVAWYNEVAHELAELDNPYWSRGDICAATHEVEQTEAQEARETLVDDFKGGHAPAYDALLGCQVVGAKTGVSCILPGVYGAAVHTPEKGVHLFTRKEILFHEATESRTK